MIFPTIHINGTAACDLIEDLSRASASLYQAILDVERAGPNGRDYYPQGPGAIACAMREHEARLTRLTIVRQEIEDIIEHVSHSL
jgi:hypothetical protein